MALALAQNGATVYILGRRLAKLEETATSFQGPSPGRIVPLKSDVASKDSLQAAAFRIEAGLGFVNLVVANAGVNGPPNKALQPRAPDDPRGPLSIRDIQEHLWQIPSEAFVDTFRINVAGALDTAVAFLSLLDKGNAQGNVSQTSQVLVTSSIAGFHRNWTAGSLAYATSKTAVNHLIKSLASVLVRWRIRVNGFAPGSELPTSQEPVGCRSALSIVQFSHPR